MVNAKNKRKPRAAKAKTLETTTTTTTAGDDGMEEQKDELLTVASLINWPSYNSLMGKLFYEKFGKVLEAKLGDYERTKAHVKECIQRNMEGDPKLTPKRGNLRKALLEQIDQMRMVTLEPNDDDDEEEEMDSTILAETAERNSPPKGPPLNNEVVMDTPEQNAGNDGQGMENDDGETPKTARQVDRLMVVANTPMEPKTPVVQVPNTPHSPIKPRIGTPATGNAQSLKRLAIAHAMQKAEREKEEAAKDRRVPEPELNFEQQEQQPAVPNPKTPGGTAKKAKEESDEKAKRKAQRLKEMEERERKAQKQREEQIRDKVERAKREREEHQQRVKNNIRQKEAEQKEQEELRRAREATVKKFEEEQKRLAASPRLQTPAKKVVSGKKVVAKKEEKTTTKKGDPKPAKETKNDGGMGHSQQENKAAVEESVILVGHFKTPRPEEKKAQEQQKQPLLGPLDLDETAGKEDISNYDMSMNKIPLPSTEENYNVDDLSSADETDPEDSPRKQIPKWAQKENLEQHIKELRTRMNPDQIDRYFGRIKQPTIEMFFGPKSRKKYPRRHDSSAIWESPMSDPTPGVGQYQTQFKPSSSAGQQ